MTVKKHTTMFVLFSPFLVIANTVTKKNNNNNNMKLSQINVLKCPKCEQVTDDENLN